MGACDVLSDGARAPEERLRPDLQDLRPIAETVAGWSRFHRTQWQHLEDYTEAAYVRRALTGTWPEARHAQDAGGPSLVVRPNLDLYAGTAGRYGLRYGNLRAEGVAPVLRRALRSEWCAGDTVWFGHQPLPPIAELAAAQGLADGPGVHFWHGSLRFLWLDRAQRSDRRG